MNKKNNKRRQETIHKIESVFLNFLQDREIQQITVSDICKEADINRSTFYANFADVYELADKICEKLNSEVAGLYREEYESGKNSNNYLKLFKHIYENQIFYKTYFKLGYDSRHKITMWDTELAKAHFNNRYIEYHLEFFKHGFNAIVKMWLNGGCLESPEEMTKILEEEYSDRGLQ